AAHGAKAVHIDQRVMTVIDKPPLRQPAMGRTTITQSRVLCGSRSRLKTSLTLGDHADDHRIRARRLLGLKQFFTEVAWVVSVRVYPNNEGSEIAIELDRPVNAATLNSTVVGDQGNTAVTERTLLHDRQCPVCTAAISNDDLGNDARRLRRKVRNRPCDMLFLVQARNNNDHRNG